MPRAADALDLRDKVGPIEGLDSLLKSVIVVHRVEDEVLKELFADHAQWLQGEDLIVLAMEDNGWHQYRGIWIDRVLGVGKSRCQQDELAHLLRMLAREECGHQAAEA